MQRKQAGGHLVIARLGAEQILKYLTRQRSHCQPVSLQHLVSTLRSFVRFLALSGHCPAELVHAVPKIQTGPRVASPHYLSEAQLQRLLESFSPQTPCGARDQAVVYCLAKLGLRAGEVARLSLEDFDWHQSTVRLTQTKGRHERLLPLSPTVGKAVAHYLRLARPTLSHRQVFVCLPGGAPLSSAQVSTLARLSQLEGKNRYFRPRRRRKCLVERQAVGGRCLATDLPPSFLFPEGIKLPPKRVPQMSFTAQRWQGTSLLQPR